MSSSSGPRKFLVRHPVVVDVGCNCRRARKLSSLFSFSSSSKPYKPSPLRPPQAPPRNHHYYPFSPSNTTTGTTTTTTSSWDTSHHPSSSSAPPSQYEEEEDTSSPSQATPLRENKKENTKKKKKKKKGRKKNKDGAGISFDHQGGRVGESVAVVKESSDPYVDFKESMLQMIVEKEIYAWDDLKELLRCLLSLNSPYHHDAILQAFAEIWDGLVSPDYSKPKPKPKPSRRGAGLSRTARDPSPYF